MEMVFISGTLCFFHILRESFLQLWCEVKDLLLGCLQHLHLKRDMQWCHTERRNSVIWDFLSVKKCEGSAQSSAGEECADAGFIYSSKTARLIKG